MNQPEPDCLPASIDARVLEAQFLVRLRCFASHRLGDAHAGEDAAQEALKRGFQAVTAGRLKQPRSLPAFIYQTTRHICLHHYRSTGREQRMLDGYGAERLLEEPAPDPLNELIQDERKAQVRGALAALKTDDRELLAALYIREQSPREVAARLRLSDEALRTRKHRALKRLGERLTDKLHPG